MAIDIKIKEYVMYELKKIIIIKKIIFKKEKFIIILDFVDNNKVDIEECCRANILYSVQDNITVLIHFY